jgi:tetratricopeptide (TPR) repeat protein
MEQIAGFGIERFPLQPHASRDERETRSRIMLARALNLRTTVAFIGSGCSSPLGYPTWHGLVKQIIEKTKSAVAALPETPERLREITSRLNEIEARVSSGERLASRDLIFYLGFCQSIMSTDDSSDPFHRCIADIIAAAKAARRQAPNPYNVLLELPITRFVTSNYDDELEEALKARKIEPLSFTQQRGDYGHLAGFAIAGVPSTRNAVFHCHGHFDDPSSIMATEADYQRWYLDQTDPASTTFRQSLDLLFGSNPVLFIGFGMEDDDLLRPLRVFSADRGKSKVSRPLFALMPDRKECQDRDRMDSLYDRFGVNVIPYDEAVDPNDAVARGQKLCDELERLHTQWLERAAQWTQKPVIRRVERPVSAQGSNLYQHYAVVLTDIEVLAPRTTEENVETLVQKIQNKDSYPRVIVITGDGGTGKSLRVLRLLDQVRASRGRFAEGKLFFWSSYYTDDWLTGLDRALGFLDTRAVGRRRRLPRFAECLHETEHLLVFDGFERLLRETGEPKLGRPYSQSVERLLKVIAGEDSRSTVILTSRLLPLPLQELAKNPASRVIEVAVERLTTDDLVSGHLFKVLKLTADEISAVCSLCAGHSYALLLAAKYLMRARGDLRNRLGTFKRDIGRRPPDSRNAAILDLVINDVDGRTNGAASKLLDRLAVFMSPVGRDTLDVCYETAGFDSSQKDEVVRVVKELLDARLLFEVRTDPPEPADAVADPLPQKMSVHPIVRSHVFHRHGVDADALPNFTLAGFTSGNAASHPGNKQSAADITALFETLCTRAIEEKRAGDEDAARSMCRAAFGLMRSRMESNTVPRWTSYEAYVRLGIRLVYVTKTLAHRTWDFVDRVHADSCQDDKGVLYTDELAWLYNDIGLALCSEGYMADAYALWEQGYEIDRVTDSEEEGGQYIVQSRLHMAHLFMELGRLRQAAQYLASTERANAIYDDDDFAGRILGYRGLLAHLAGNLDEADDLYGTALKRLRANGRHNLRAESIFHRYWADLMMAARDLDEAERHVSLALAYAREGDFPDLEAYARKSLAHTLRERRKDFAQAQLEYNTALRMARSLGIKRLQADLLSELARLALDVGDWETARRRVTESLLLANELSLGLRRTHGLVILGLATKASGNVELAKAYFRHAYALANHQGYHLRGREVEQELHRLGVDPAALGA